VVDDGSRNDFYDSLVHSAAVVGINTTALIEAVIVGKSVFTVLAPEFRDTQEGTLHFHYLRHDNGGFLHEAADLDEHFDQLATHLAGGDEDREQLKRFTETFVRPHGLDVPVTPILADDIEQLGADGRLRPTRTPLWALGVRVVAAVATLRVPAGLRGPIRHMRARARWLLSASASRTPIVARLSGSRRSHHGPTAAAEPVPIKAILRPLHNAPGSRLIGPWRGNVEDEILFWIPFLRRLEDDGSFEPTRDVVLATPDRVPLYGGFGVEVRAADEDGSAAVLTPDAVRRFFAPFLEGHGEIKPIIKHVTHQRLAPFGVPTFTDDRYVAVGCATSAAFPDEAAAAELAARIVGALADRAPVALVAGDAAECASHVADVRADQQTRWSAIAHADGFIGTWSDEALLAVLFGVATVVVAPTDDAYAPRFDLAMRMARATGAPLTIVDTVALPLVSVVAGVVAKGPRESTRTAV
jgi:hypothetical protein